MILSWICCWLFFTVTAMNTQHLTGSLGKQFEQKYSLFYDLHVCALKIYRSSVVDASMSLYRCVKKHLYHCHYTQPSQHATNAFIPTNHRNRPYCGSIWIKDKPVIFFKKEISIEMIHGHNIHFSMLAFNFSLYRHMLCQSHSITLVSRDQKTEAYCGLRVPWTFIMQDHRVLLQFVISNNKEYTFKLFYSSFHPNWISNVSRILKKSHPPLSSINYFSASLNLFEVNIVYYGYYIFARRQERLYISVALSDLRNIRLRIHDGPGPLSNTLVYIDGEKIDKALYIRSTAYAAFVWIKPIDSEQNTSVTFHIKLRRKVFTFRECASKYVNGILKLKSNKWTTVACVFNFGKPDEFVGFDVISFEFYGPSMFTDLTAFYCQYGGLEIEVEENGGTFLTCENVQGLEIHSQHQSITLIVAWFSGYSQGHILTSTTLTYCRYFYADLPSPAGLYNNSVDAVLKFDSERMCNFLICRPSLDDSQTKCVFKLGPPDPGTATIKVILKDYIYPCTPDSSIVELYDRNISMTAVFSDDYPFTLVNTTRSYAITQMFLKTSTETYNYLHNATAVVPHLCMRFGSYKQLAMHVIISTCSPTPPGFLAFIMIVNNMPGLTDHCLNVGFDITPAAKVNNKNKNYFNYFMYLRDKKRISNFSDLHFSENGYVHKTYEVRLIYMKCPTECKTYKYSIYVKAVDNATIYEYTSNVGDYTLIQEHHRGFRISLSTDQAPCQSYTSCHIRLTISRPLINVETTTGRMSSLLLLKTRYTILDNILLLCNKSQKINQEMKKIYQDFNHHLKYNLF